MSKKQDKDRKNPYGYGSGEYWEEEYRRAGLTREQYHEKAKREARKCPYCGAASGYSMGTGDCGCGDEY